jgi:hypothetical protein
MRKTNVERARKLFPFPILGLPLAALGCRNLVPPCVFMWILSFAIYFSLKLLVWSRARSHIAPPLWRSLAFLLAWPGMDANTFLDVRERVAAPRFSAWLWAVAKTAIGAILLWAIARTIPPRLSLLRGWMGMISLILILHFGSFQLVALFWQSRGIKADSIMSAPIQSTSLAEFWGKRWNLWFRQLAHELVFRPLYRVLGPNAAGFVVFVISGLIHDLVISVPARGGYGLPTLYFLLQGVGVTAERSHVGSRLGLARGVRGWCFMALFLMAPVFWLFHPWFVARVILPFMRAVHAI